MGFCLRENFKSMRSFSLPFAEHNPSAETNSVKNTEGFPCFANISLKAKSVTSAMGARIRMGFFCARGASAFG